MVYVLGGVTFLPLVTIAVFAYAYHTFPRRDGFKHASASATDDLIQPDDHVTTTPEAAAALKAEEKKKKKKKEKTRPGPGQEADQAAGYFAVCREYTPMAINNAKAIERMTTPAGSGSVAAPSQSIYQTMYRGIFERKQVPSSIDANGAISHQQPKSRGNLYYVILRHGHLLLFDDENQAEVRYVISLLLHDISIYSGGGEGIAEGDLFIKRNAICLSPKTSPDPKPSKPFYLFCDNCSSKEDFYFSLLRSQDQVLGAQAKAPRPLHFDTKNIIDLVRRLYELEDNRDMRWLNALIGRVFLGIYQTKDVQNFVIKKITKKISAIKRPSFLTHIIVRRIDLGESAPFVSHPQLKNLTVQGECVAEAHLRYTGNFRIEVATTARVDIGHFTKEVALVLAVVVKKLQGDVLVKIKPPPSNRVWLSFSRMPKLEMVIEPIVSSRQITWTIILNQIENRIREGFAESMVLPFWDDVPFFPTEHKKWRGGIWQDDDAVVPPPDPEAAAAQEGNIDEEVDKLERGAASETRGSEASLKDKTQAGPCADDSASPSVPAVPCSSLGALTRSDTGNPPKCNATMTPGEPKSPSRAPRTGSFTRPPMATVSTDTTNADVFKPVTPPESADVASRIATVFNPSQNEPQEHVIVTRANLPPQPQSSEKTSSLRSTSSREGDKGDNGSAPSAPSRTKVEPGSLGATSSMDSSTLQTSTMSSKFLSRPQATTSALTKGFLSQKDDSQASGPSTDKNRSTSKPESSANKMNTLAAVSNAALQAGQWGLNALKRNDGGKNQMEGRRHHHVDLSQPMGRGQPLPPPGVPLPMPARKTPTAPIPPGKRKIAPPPPLNGDVRNMRPRQWPKSDGAELGAGASADVDGHDGRSSDSGGNEGGSRPRRIPPRRVPAPPPPLPPPLPPKRAAASNGHAKVHQDQERVLIVPAPESSEPSTPLSGGYPSPGFAKKAWDRTSASPCKKTQLESTGPGSEGSEIRHNVKGSSRWIVPDLSPSLGSNVKKSLPLVLPPPKRGGPPTSSCSTTLQQQRGGSSNNFGEANNSDNDSCSEWIDGQDFEGLKVDLPPGPHARDAADAAGAAGSADTTGTAGASPHTATYIDE